MLSLTESANNTHFEWKKLFLLLVRSFPYIGTESLTQNIGSNCGSSYANQTLKHQAIEKIKSTAYESLKGPSFEYIIEHDIMNEFEYKIKRGFNPADGLDGDEVIVVHGLERNERLGFGHHTMRIKRFVNSSVSHLSY